MSGRAHGRFAERVAFGGATLLRRSGLTLLPLLLASCLSTRPAEYAALGPSGHPDLVHNSIVCIVHGDGDYIFHDSVGSEQRADERVLEELDAMAARLHRSEVFVFHQRPTSRLLFLFPRDDGMFSYYRNGRLVARESYRRPSGGNRFDAEAALYREFHGSANRDGAHMLLYFGHEIPDADGAGYDRSTPERRFNTDTFAAALPCFSDSAVRIDLAIVSTCYNGSPHMMAAVAPSVRYVVASPENLHLSYFDPRAIADAETMLQTDSIARFARMFAGSAFARLSQDVETAVSVCVYDVDRVRPYLRAAMRVYHDTMPVAAAEASAERKHCDCADLPSYRTPAMNDGVDVFFRPAQFGRNQQVAHHSGWECVRLQQRLWGDR